MTLSDVKLAVDSRNNKLNSEFDYDSGFEYCRDFRKNNNLSSAGGFLNADIYELCKCIYYIKKKDSITIKDACTFIDSFSEYVKMLDFISFSSFADLLLDISDSNVIEDIIDYIEEKSDIKARKRLNKFRFISSDGSSSSYMSNEKQTMYIELLKLLRERAKDCDIPGLLRECSKKDNPMPLIFGLIVTHKQMSVDKDLIIDQMEHVYQKKPGSSTSKKQVNNYLKEKYDIKGLLQEIEMINRYVLDEEQRESTFNKNNLREINNNLYALELLEKESSKEEITDARNIVKKIKDEDLKRCFLKFIYEHNMKYYAVLDEKITNIRRNTVTSYFDELVRYDIVISKEEVNELMYNTFDDFKEILSILNKISFDKYQILRILKSTNLKVVSKLFCYITEGYLNKDYVLLHLELFDFKSNVINIIDRNISMLSKQGINPKIFINSPNILLDENGIVEVNLQLLEKYNLKIFLKNSSSFNYLLDTNLSEKIDKMIELGYLSFVENDLGVLDSSNLKRLEVLKSMNIVVLDKNEFNEVLNKNRFIISDDCLDDYIIKVTDTKRHVDLKNSIEDLETFRVDNNTYMIDGVIISFNKVNRLLGDGCDMYNALFYNMILSDSEYDSVLKKLNNNSYQMYINRKSKCPKRV